MITVTTVIPTYRRPKDLVHCLEALKQQRRPADEVLVVVRDNDSETWALLSTFNFSPLPLRTVTVRVSGVVAALDAAFEQVKGDIIAVTDDDAAPHVDWLERMEHYYLSDPLVGGVGGRDWVYVKDHRLANHGTSELVGLVAWSGRVIGNHHIGVGKAREVDVLKGVNMSFRKTAIAGLRFDERMHGTGAQVHFELAFSLSLKRAGWKIIYDPMIAVDHYPSQRFDEDQRNQFNHLALSSAVHNETLALLEHLPPARRAVFLVWSLLVGTREARGLVQWLRFLPSEGNLAGQKWLASMRGRWQGWHTWRDSKQDSKSGRGISSKG
jgi:glycosyltransferase involved in cell wall biosynthesis